MNARKDVGIAGWNSAPRRFSRFADGFPIRLY
jgi:hypothetical protein